MNTDNENKESLNFEELDKNEDGVLSKQEYEAPIEVPVEAPVEAPVEEVNLGGSVGSQFHWQSRHGYSLVVNNLADYGLNEEQAAALLKEADATTSWDDNPLDAHVVFVNAGHGGL